MYPRTRQAIFSDDYVERVRKMDEANLIGCWTHGESTSAIAFDQSPQKNNGAYTAVALGRAGIGDGGTSALFDGSASFNNIYSVASDFNGTEGGLLIWGKVSAAGVWEDSTARSLITLWASNDNRLSINRTTTNNQIRFAYKAGGTLETYDLTISRTGWTAFGLTWSDTGDKVKYFENGVLKETDTGVGTWSGAVQAAASLIGASNSTPTQVWSGFAGPAFLWKGVPSDTLIKEASTVRRA